MSDKNYEKLINDIVEISSISNKNNSILYNFSINKDNVKSTISIIDYQGNKKLLKSYNLDIENKFYKFITPLIKGFSEYNNIVFSDFVDMNEDNIVTYRLITANNDQFSVDGLTFEDANYIRDVVSDIKINDSAMERGKVLTLSNDKGATSIWLIITIIIIIGLLVVCSAYFI